MQLEAKMVELKINHEVCIVCGACTCVDGCKFEIKNGKVIAKGNYSKEKAQEIIETCPVNAISCK